MKLINLLLATISAGNFDRMKRFHGFHGQRLLENSFQHDDLNKNQSGMTSNQMAQDEIDPRLQFLIDSMITVRKTPSVRDFTAWNLYKRNLNP